MHDPRFGAGPDRLRDPHREVSMEINFRSAVGRLVLAGDRPREGHEDITMRLLLERERRKNDEHRRENPVIIMGRG